MSNEISKSAVERLILLEEDVQFKLLNDSLREFASKNKGKAEKWLNLFMFDM